ncbi:hypothetical protein [Pseudomonas sp. Fig-3]|nr:hypothetical protein [Pseudomonas sp. Fig-3]
MLIFVIARMAWLDGAAQLDVFHLVQSVDMIALAVRPPFAGGQSGGLTRQNLLQCQYRIGPDGGTYSFFGTNGKGR